MKINIKPLGNNILVEPLEREQKLPSGLVIPDSAKEKPQEGKVVAVGPGKTDHGQLVKMTVKVGDRVLYAKYGYDEVKIDGEEYYILSESSILAIVG